jgi:hypothetical protein
MIRPLALAAALVLAGCTAAQPAAQHGADHPASAASAAAPHQAHADALPEAAQVYAPSGVPAAQHSHGAHAAHSAGAPHQHAEGKSCEMGCCDDGACGMPCCDKHGEGEGHASHDHGEGEGEGEGCQMACCQEGGSCKHEGHAGHGAHSGHVDLSRSASHSTPRREALELSGSDQAAFRSALGVYLAIADRLASDSVDGVAEDARTLEAGAAQLAEASALGSHAGHLAAIRQHAAHLAAATTLPDARDAFGELSPAFAHLVAAVGVPSGLEVTRYVCGMADAPEGGVWLQAAGEPRNPYFGATMLRCHRAQQAL